MADGLVAPTVEQLPCKEKAESSNLSRSTKHCNKCGQDKPLEEFHNSTRSKDGKWNYCKPCTNARSLAWYHENKTSPEYLNYSFRARLGRYKLTLHAYALLLAAQGGGCAVCGDDGELVIDHDHSCCPSYRGCCGKCVRGLLCHRCNRALGLLGDSPELIKSLLGYAEKHQRNAA
jgi:Recombination endonuclease VII